VAARAEGHVVSSGVSAWIARSLAALAVVMSIGGAVAYWSVDAQAFVAADLASLAQSAAFAIVGTLIASSHPRNAIGWICLGVALSGGLDAISGAIVALGLQSDADPGALVGAAAVYFEFSWLAYVMVPATFLLLLFPNGRVLSRRWGWVACCAAGGILGVLVTSAASPAPLSESPSVANPFAIDSPLLEPLEIVSTLVMFVGIFGSVASLVVRFRRADRRQREQIKWLATAGAILAVTAPIDAALAGVLGDAQYLATTLALLGMPVAIGIAILRHRLYDVDVVINRALVYGALTAGLAGTYLAGVLLLQLLLGAFTANNGLAIAGSTLAIAALFQPARRRIQSVVDRRFFRSKYDAARTLDRFGAHLRDEVDLETLGDELRAVVAQTMQPAHVTLWLRAPEAGR